MIIKNVMASRIGKDVEVASYTKHSMQVLFRVNIKDLSVNLNDLIGLTPEQAEQMQKTKFMQRIFK